MKKETGFTLTELIITIFAIVMLAGWVRNVFVVASLIGAGFTPEVVLRGVAIFVAPVGALFGIFWW